MFSHHRDVVCMVNFLNTIRLAAHDPHASAVLLPGRCGGAKSQGELPNADAGTRGFGLLLRLGSFLNTPFLYHFFSHGRLSPNVATLPSVPSIFPERCDWKTWPPNVLR